MARMRTLKPEFFRDKKIRQLTPTAALVYQALWCMADDGGVAPADPERIYGEMFIGWEHISLPDVELALTQLYGSRRVALYRVGDDQYAEIPKFTDHQKPKNPSQHRYPRGGERVTENPTPALPQPYPSVVSSQVSVVRSQESGVSVAAAPRTDGKGLPHPTCPPDWNRQLIAIRKTHVPGDRISPGRVLAVLTPFVRDRGWEEVRGKWETFCRVGRNFRGLSNDPDDYCGRSPLPVTALNPERFRDTYAIWTRWKDPVPASA